MEIKQTVVIVDLSGRCNQLIARSVRNLNVYCRLVGDNANIADIQKSNPIGIILTGESDEKKAIETEVASLGVPVLDIRNIDIESKQGAKDLKKFLFKTCKAKGDWTMKAFTENMIEELKEKIGDKKVLCALSGGVDSAVCAALIHKANKDCLTCVFVDHGLMRKGEPEQVVDVFRNKLGMNLIHIDASERFLTKLEGVSDPERKRKIIGEEFIRVFEEEAKKIGAVDFLVQGTIYPDIIESGIGSKGLVKSHHNVGGLPDVIDFNEILEPVKDLFKDEVRKVGIEVGLPLEQVNRQPFPGPGLGVRCIGEITRERLAILKDADFIMREEIAKAGWDTKIWQYFAVITDMKSVGVRNEVRSYEYTVALRAIHSIDAMTAQFVHLPFEILETISRRITSEVVGVNRVVYDITSKPPATIEWE